jgi:predicted PP-loop superfamily ATPase
MFWWLELKIAEFACLGSIFLISNFQWCFNFPAIFNFSKKKLYNIRSKKIEERYKVFSAIINKQKKKRKIMRRIGLNK